MKPPQPPPHASLRRADLFDFLLIELSRAQGDATPASRHRELSDPTIALLDAWATAGDVLGFYLDRIADEGYVSSASEPGSILALASLAGHRPRPGVAARVHLAYQLNIDPEDKAVVLAPGLLSQSVPGPGEEPQKFETIDALVARPSWGVLSPRRTRPLAVADAAAAAQLPAVVVAGTTANIATNDMLLLDLAGTSTPALRRVAAAEADMIADRTTLTLQPEPPPYTPEPAPGDGGEDATPAAEPTPAPGDADASAPQTAPGGADATPAADDAGASAAPAEASPVPPAGAAAASADAAPSAATATPVPATGAAPAPGPAPAPAGPDDVTSALDGVVARAFASSPAPVPASANDLPRSIDATFGPQSDATPRILAALQPAVAGVLYPALATSTIGRPSVTNISVLRVDARPYGAQAPPIRRFDEHGQPAGTTDWPIGETHTLTLRIREADLFSAVKQAPALAKEDAMRLLTANQPRFLALASIQGVQEASTRAIHVGCTDGAQRAQCVLSVKGDGESKATLGDLGDIKLTLDSSGKKPPAVLSYTSEGARVKKLVVTAIVKEGRSAVSLEIDGGISQSWAPGSRGPVHVQVGGRRLSITSTTELVGSDPEPIVVVEIETALALAPAARKVLPLDRVYDKIVRGTRLVVERVDDKGDRHRDMRTVEAVKVVTENRFAMSAEVTQLELDEPWLDDKDVTQASLRAFRIRAQPDALLSLPVPIADEDVAGPRIELDGLVAGMEAGRLIVVRGTRTDLPGGAAVEDGEAAMVAEIRHGSGGDGDTPRTTLGLAAPLAYAYRRDSVRIYGNVVAARQGATITEVLGSGDPSQPHQSFTLSTAPLLADAAPTADGSVSTLTVTVDGAGYREVERFDGSTPPQSFRTTLDPQGHTTITFASPLPQGTENVHASYRAGDGGQGNMLAGQVSQLLSRPAGVGEVSNPLPAGGGRAGDGPESVRSGAPRGLQGLGRIVSVSDYADRAGAWSGVGKASAELIADPGRERVVLTVAGSEPVPLDPDGALCTGLAATIRAEADPVLPLVVVPADLYVIVLRATVTHDPLVGWTETVDAVRAALLETFGYDRRKLGRDVARGDLVAAAHRVPAVRSFVVTSLALVPATVTATELATTLPRVLGRAVPEVVTLGEAAAEWRAAPAPGGAAPAAVAFLSAAVSDTLMLREHPR